MLAVRVAADAEHEAVHAAPYAGPRYRELCTAFAGLAPSSGPFFARGNCVWPSRGWPRATDCSLMRRNPPRASRGWPRAAVSSLMRGNRPRASRGWPRAPDCSLMLQKIVRRRRGAPRRPRGHAGAGPTAAAVWGRRAAAVGPRIGGPTPQTVLVFGASFFKMARVTLRFSGRSRKSCSFWGCADLPRPLKNNGLATFSGWPDLQRPAL